MNESEKLASACSRSGHCHGYIVEVRLNSTRPAVVNNMLLDTRWQRVSFSKTQQGVPRGPWYLYHELAGCDLLGYASAQALRWWFIANADADIGTYCLETRLVEYRIEYSTKTEPLRSLDVVEENYASPHILE